MEKKKISLGNIGIIAIIVAVIGIFGYSVYIMISPQNTGAVSVVNSAKERNAVVSATLENGVQTINLTFKGYNYYPQIIQAKSGIPLRIVGDMSKLQGCFRSLVIPAYGIRKVLTPSDNVIEFTPNKVGTSGFSCFMGMGTGTLQIV